MTAAGGSHPGRSRTLPRLRAALPVIIVSSATFTFISAWKTAAVVLCDLASTSYYIGGIVEQSIGPAAPWFILAVLAFSYAVRWVYIESCTLFVRGGVYRVVREALGSTAAKLAVSALLFDFVLTGPISGVSAGQYVMGLLLEFVHGVLRLPIDPAAAKVWKAGGAMVLASLVTLYFYWQNLKGIQESADKAVKIMAITALMAVVLVGWSVTTLVVEGPRNAVPLEPDFHVKLNHTTGKPEDPLGFVGVAAEERLSDLGEHTAPGWLSLFGVAGLFIAFGHSILAMSGEETLAQVYREVEAPKLPNFKKAAFLVFAFSLLLTGSVSFLAVLLIPNEERMRLYSDNLLGGLAMHVLGPPWLRLVLNAAVVLVGFLLLSGAVNTAIIGSNGVLNRVAEDGVLPTWLLKPHRTYGTTHRILALILAMQLFTIVASRGDVIWLGEAYAFGVVWSFVFQALAMVVLRFKDRRPREFAVPLNLRVGGVLWPIGLGIILAILLLSAVANLLTKETATLGGGTFTLLFFGLFWATERYYRRPEPGSRHEHREQFNQREAEQVTAEVLGLDKQYRKLVAIRSPRNLTMLEKALAETDPGTTAVVVMTAKVTPPGDDPEARVRLDAYDEELLTAVVQRAERTGKQVRPLIVPTNNPLHAVVRTAKDLQAHELILGASNKHNADEQLEQVAFYWISQHQGLPAPLTVRVLGRDRDLYLDLAGGNRIPKITERQARSVAELRAAGVGADRVLLVHDGTPPGSDLFQEVLTMLDESVCLTLVPTIPVGADSLWNGHAVLLQDRERAQQLGREVQVEEPRGELAPELVRLAREGKYDLLVVPLPPDLGLAAEPRLDAGVQYLLREAPCRVLLAAAPTIPHAVVDDTPGG